MMQLECEAIVCGWFEPESMESSERCCGKPATHFYLQNLINPIARCLEHRTAWGSISQEEYIALGIMGS